MAAHIMIANGLQTYFVIPLSIQAEGDGYLVGSQELEDFYQFPEEGLRVITLLRQGRTIDEVKAECDRVFDEQIDVDDFIGVLTEIGFIFPTEQQADFQQKLDSVPPDKRWKFALPQHLAGAVFSAPMLVVYLGILGYAIVSAVADPRLRINPHALYIQENFTITLLALLLLQAITTALHELGHMTAAAKYGIKSKLGWGNRLWSIVAEADLSGIHSLPKQQRYLPLMAGLITDLLNIACVTLLIKLLLANNADPFVIQIFQALILQILFTMSWQFNVFLKTDIYYALCVYCTHPNLDSEARVYLRAQLHRLSAGRLGAPGQGRYHNLATLRAFAALWLVGRALALVLLFAVVIPTLFRYGRDAWRVMGNSVSSNYDKWDLSLFFILSSALVALGLYVWLKGRTRLSKGN